MPVDLGDRYSGCSLFATFTTVNTSGVPTSITGTPGNQGTGNTFLYVWKTSTWTCSTSGLTQSFDCKGATGVNAFAINTNADQAFYSCGYDYVLMINGGQVASNCISGYTLATFSLKNRAGLQPTIHSRSVDVSSGGEVGIDWANIGSPQTVQSLGCTAFFSAHTICNSVTATASVPFTEQGIACTVWNSLQANYDVCGSFGVLLDCRTSAALQPTTPGTRVAVSTGGAVALDWANIESPQAVQRLGCTSIYAVGSVCNSVVTSGGTIDTVTTTVNVNNLVGGSITTLSYADNVIDSRILADSAAQEIASAVMSCSISEPSGVFSWASATPRAILGWLGALGSNCVRQTSAVQTLRNRADSSSIATAALTCAAGTVNRGSFS